MSVPHKTQEKEPSAEVTINLRVRFPSDASSERFLSLLAVPLNISGISGAEVGKRVSAARVEAGEDGVEKLIPILQVGPKQ